jgi:hypothetical protein
MEVVEKYSKILLVHVIPLSFFQFPPTLAFQITCYESHHLSRRHFLLRPPPHRSHFMEIEIAEKALELIYIQWQTHKVTEHAEHEINWI